MIIVKMLKVISRLGCIICILIKPSLIIRHHKLKFVLDLTRPDFLLLGKEKEQCDLATLVFEGSSVQAA
jgi:hypothetical protein